MASPINSELVEQLNQGVLDGTYWAEVLRTKLGITNPQQIEFLDGEDLEALKSSLRYKWEEKALRKFIGITNEPTSPQGENDDKHKIMIVAELNKACLDGEYWAEILKTNLGVTRIEQMANLNSDDLKKLENSVNHVWEKKALRKLLGISDQPLAQEPKAMDMLVKRIDEWNSRPVQPGKCVEYLQEVLQIVEEVEAQTGTNKYWVDKLCNTQLCLSNFLGKVVELGDQFDPKDVPMIRFLIRKLVNPVGVKVFSGKPIIMEWAEMEKEIVDIPTILGTSGIKSIPDFIRILKEQFIPTLQKEHAKNVKGNKQVSDHINAGATIDLARCIGQLLNDLRSSDRLHEMFFLNISVLSVHYQWSKSKFVEVLTMENLNTFSQEIEVSWKEFQVHKEKGQIQFEAFLIHTYFGKEVKPSEDEFFQLMTDLQRVISPQIQAVLNWCTTSSPFNWAEIIRVTGEVVNGNMEVVEESKFKTRNLHDGPKSPREPNRPCQPVTPVQHESTTFSDGGYRQKQQRSPIKRSKPDSVIPVKTTTFQSSKKTQKGPNKPNPSAWPKQGAFEEGKPVSPVKNKTLTFRDSQYTQESPIKPLDPAGPEEGAFEEILIKLGLYEYYPSKISNLDAMIIKQVNTNPKLVDLPWMIIKKLFLIDFHARDGVWSLIKASEERERHSGTGDFDLSGFLLETQNTFNEDDTETLNTLDVLVAIFTCCDNMLKQIIAEKFFVCKLAIPFLYPIGPESNIMMSLWALRTITVQWNAKNKEIIETQVTQKPFPVVSFIRFGRPPMSKSKLMNDILRDNSHDTFFHHDCNNGTIPRRLTNGLVECTWFVTSGKEKEHLPCTTMFLNLRGDASLMEKQMQFLQEMSSVVFIVATAEDLAITPNTEACQQVYRSGAKVILFLISGNDKQERQRCVEALGMEFLSSVRIIHSMRQGGQKNASELRIEARKELSEAIGKCPGMILDECARLAAEKGIIVDEYDDAACLKGRDLAQKILKHMKGKNIVDCKQILLPLQGAEWLEYCKLKKKQHRTSAKGARASAAYQADQMKQQMDRLRKKQADKGDNGLTPFVKEFMSTLQRNEDVVLYFLMWMNMLLDEKSRANLPGLRKRYHNLWGEFQDAKKKQKEEQMQQLKLQVDDAEHQLASASLGRENLFRELGQVYEASKESRKLGKDTKVNCLPEIAAKLLKKGIPLELIDGDASSVPISWVKAVLQNLGNIIGEKRLFVISVLGIQSSGKSTLLNTMFGLKFSVSAGRCTRGAYMQLIPVDKSAKLPFDYIVVVDTEGLRAPELGQLKHEHDNELATLVIGLGDVTIVNIKGENTAEVKDTLQIAVHAFLRMNLVRKHMEDHRSCIFVHQNVPAANAEALMMHGCQKLQEDLDDMVKEAAQSENIANINNFSQIINFDVQKHVWYISDLWHGDPPMAPANPGYSEKVNAVRVTLLQDIVKGRKSFLTASDLSLRLEDLWNGVLADDFVFSFRNSLEMKAYTSLQSKYYTLEWELQKCLKDWLQKAEIKLKISDHIDELESSFRSLDVDLSHVLTKRAEEIKSCLDEYFEESNLKDIIIQWQQSKKNQLDFAVQQHQNEGRIELTSIYEGRRVEIMQTQKWTHHEAHIMKEAVELAKKFKGKQVSEFELQKQFDSMWTPMVHELATKSDEKELDIDNLMEGILYKRLGSSSTILRDELWQYPLKRSPTHALLEGSIREDDITGEHISLKRSFGTKFKGLVSKVGWTKDPEAQAKYETLTLTENILKEISGDLKRLSSHDTKYLRSHAVEVIQKLVEKLDTHNQKALSSDKCNFTILPTYYVKLAVHVSRHCVQVFNTMQREYIKKHGVKAKLEVYKNTAWTFFKNMVKQSTEEVVAGDLLCTQLKEVISKAVKTKLPQQYVEEVLIDFQMTKYYLIVKIMDDLACKENFEDYALYIRNAKEFVLKWITRYTNEKIFSNQTKHDISRYAKTASIHIAKIIDCIEESVEHATSEASEDGLETMALWIEHFCQKVSEELAVPVSSLKLVGDRKVKDFNNLQRIILDQLKQNIQPSLQTEFERETEHSVDWDGKPPSKQILDKIWGCPEQCRFCNEPCIDTTDGHYSSSDRSHMCMQHRPKGIGGTHWSKDGVFDDDKHSKDQLSTENCMYSVQCKDLSFRCWKCTKESEDEVWHKYREYKSQPCMKDWDIAPDVTNSVSKYWMWFMATYKHELTDMYELVLPDIPESWNSITKEEALEDLRKIHN